MSDPTTCMVLCEGVDALIVFGTGVLGLLCGRMLEARRWRSKGDAGLTSMESGGRLYRVTREAK